MAIIDCLFPVVKCVYTATQSVNSDLMAAIRGSSTDSHGSDLNFSIVFLFLSWMTQYNIVFLLYLILLKAEKCGETHIIYNNHLNNLIKDKMSKPSRHLCVLTV